MSESKGKADMRVVVVDDDPIVLKISEAILKDAGFRVNIFSESPKALDWIAAHGADIVVSDIEMPDCDGFDVLKRVKEIAPGCDLIFATVHGKIDIAIRAMREGAADFIEKPIEAATLQAALERTNRYRALKHDQDLLTEQVDLLRDELSNRIGGRSPMIGRSDAMKRIAEDIKDIASSTATVLILGESGSGKEVIATAIHCASPREKKPFLTLNCASIPEQLFEAEMFGHTRGAFTGAVESRGGYVGAAHGGTLFLDEIGDMPMAQQSKILRLLEQKTYVPVGGHDEKRADIRIIAATNQPLETLVEEKEFREDLYYRLSVCAVSVPPLRDRKDDIEPLAEFFTLRYAREMGKSIQGVDADALEALMDHAYPGNVRELRNMIEASIIRCKHGGKLRREDLHGLGGASLISPRAQGWRLDTMNLEEVERLLIEEALRQTDSNVSAAGRLMGITRGKLRSRMSDLGIEAPRA